MISRVHTMMGPLRLFFQCGSADLKQNEPIRVLALVLFASLSGCAVGPDFEPPAPPGVTSFTPEKTASPGGGQRFVEGADVPSRWWTAFRCERLNGLIEEAIAKSPTLDAAEAAIRVAQYNRDVATGSFLPQVTLNSNSSYLLPQVILNSNSSNSLPQAILNSNSGSSLASGDSANTVTQKAFSYFTKQVQVSYSPDIWGANRRTVESLEAQKENQYYQREAAYLSLAGNVVKAAIEEASLRAQIVATKRVVELERERLSVLERQLALGAVAGTDILSQQTALAQALQYLPTLERRLAQQRNLLAALVGRYPSDKISEVFELSQLTLPSDLPVSLPSQVVAQRPDIKAAEANVHSANAQIGVAVAARLPNIVLSANGGMSAVQLAQLFTPGAGFYTLAGNVAQTAFDGFTLLNKQRAAEAGLDQALAQYRGVVINAFQNVADSLRALQADASTVKAASVAENTSKKYLDRIRSQQRFGGVSQLAVIDAQRAYLSASISRVQAESDRLANTVALFIALGGGWWNREASK